MHLALYRKFRPKIFDEVIGQDHIVRALKKSKKEQAAQDAKNAAEVAEAEAKAQVAIETAENTNRVCAYCGAPVPDGDIRCPSCGSTEFTKK